MNRHLIFVDYIDDRHNDGICCDVCGHDVVNFVMEPAFNTVYYQERVHVCGNCFNDNLINTYSDSVAYVEPIGNMLTGSFIGGQYVKDFR
jgi:hypothetical protein